MDIFEVGTNLNEQRSLESRMRRLQNADRHTALYLQSQSKQGKKIHALDKFLGTWL